MPRMLVATTIAGTAESFLLPHVDHLRAAGWTVDGMAAGITGSPACVESFDAVHEASWSRRPLAVANLRAAREAGAVVRAGDYDIVHVHTPVASFVTRFAMRGMRGRTAPAVVYTAHGFHFSPDRTARENLTFRTLERIAGRWTDRLVVINSVDEAQARDLRIVPPEAVVRVPGVGIDTSVWDRAAVPDDAIAAAVRDVGLPSGSRYVACVGELNPGKRPAEVLRAFASGAPSDMRLLMIGEGPERAACEALAERLGVADRVTVTGWRSDVRELLCGASVLVHASEREGLPRSVMEAMCLGLPVAAAAARGTSDLLADGRGVLVPIGDVDALASAIGDLLADGESAARMAARARAYAERELALSHVLAMMDELYESVLAEKGRA